VGKLYWATLFPWAPEGNIPSLLGVEIPLGHLGKNPDQEIASPDYNYKKQDAGCYIFQGNIQLPASCRYSRLCYFLVLFSIGLSLNSSAILFSSKPRYLAYFLTKPMAYTRVEVPQTFHFLWLPDIIGEFWYLLLSAPALFVYLFWFL
jgi:hypothetical protein